MKAYKLFTYLLTLSLATLQASQMSDQELNNNNTNLQPDKQDLELQEGIEKYLPQFFKNNKKMLEKLQEGKRQAVVVIGQTGAGKSTLIGGLLGHEFKNERKEVITPLEDNTTKIKKRKVLVNKNPYAPKIGYNKMISETTLLETYLDQETNLAFIDTAGLVDTRNDGKAINLCNAIALRSLIQKIGGVKCIIGVISYNNFIEAKGSKVFLTLLNVTSSMLKNTSPETLTSSIVLAFTKVSSDITTDNINEELEDQCDDLMQKKKNKQMTEEDKLAEIMYKILFPSFYGIKDKKNVPFFLISQNNLLKQGLVRKHVVPTLQNARQVHSKDIGLVLEPHLLQKTQDWLAKRAQSIANDIKDTNRYKDNIASNQETLLFNQQELFKQKELLAELTDPNNKDKKETFKKSLNETIQNNPQRIQKLAIKIKENKQESFNKKKEKQKLDTNQAILHKRISGSYSKHIKYSKVYKYSYNDVDVPINHIRYDKNGKKDPSSGDHFGNYKVLSITKNYDKGELSITLENDIHRGIYIAAGVFSIVTVGYGTPIAGAILGGMKLSSPNDFYIYAKKKHIYHNDIKTLKDAINNLEDRWFEARSEKQSLEKEVQLSKRQLQQLQSNNLTKDDLLQNNKFCSKQLKQASKDLLQEKQMIEHTKQSIEDKDQAIKKIESDLKDREMLLLLLTDKIKQNEIIPDIITQVAPFIEFYDRDQQNIDTCKQYYINNLKQQNQHNNNLVQDNTNKKHSDYQPGGEDDLEQKNDCDNNNNNNNNSSSLTSSLLVGGTLLGSVLKKKN